MTTSGVAAARPKDAQGRSLELSTRTSLVVAAAATVVATASAWLLLTSPWRGTFDETGWWLGFAASVFTMGVGLVGWRVRPANRVGPLLILLGFVSFVPWLSHSGDPAVWTLGTTWDQAAIAVTAHLYLAFPEGRTHGWSRRLTVTIYAWFLLNNGTRLIMREYEPESAFQNPFGIWPNNDFLTSLGTFDSVFSLVIAFLVFATVVQRWRRGTAVARRALAPVFGVSAILVVVVASRYIGSLTGDAQVYYDPARDPLTAIAGFLLPAAFLVGLLRTRLDRASIAELVQELDGVGTADLEAALARAIHDPTLKLAFAAEGSTGYVDAAGQPFPAPEGDASRAVTRIGSGGDALAILVHDASAEAELVESAAAASHLALENARLTAELRAQLGEARASRLRIVEAADEERRRIERDLHDGAQQRLVALGFALRDASRRSKADEEVAAILDGAQAELEAGLRELRAIARGLHPTALDDGLAPALNELADRSPVPVQVEMAQVSAGPTVEATAYYVVAEALTNALRHADAERIVVRGVVEEGRLRLVISDDGRGGAGDTAEGTGMRGLADRVQAIGGTIRVESPAGAGTTVIAELPLG